MTVAGENATLAPQGQATAMDDPGRGRLPSAPLADASFGHLETEPGQIGDGGLMLCGSERDAPVTWTCFAEQINLELAERERRGEVPKGYRLFYNPHNLLLTQIALGRPFAYLCWGAPKRGAPWRRLRVERLRFILRAARVLLVHDVVTRRWIRRHVGREAILVPLPVDMQFFTPPPARRSGQGFLLVPGNNDRNEDYVLQLAASWGRVVRVSSDPRTIERYAKSAPNAPVTLEYRVPWERLRELYRSAEAVVLPTGGTTHAGGQTAMLEALACGTPVLTDSAHLLSIARFWQLPVHRLPRDPRSVARVVGRLACDPTNGIRLPRAFSVEECLTTYKSVIGSAFKVPCGSQ
jgi:hypothetical protein